MPLEPTQLQNIATALGGFGAGLQGNLPQFMQTQQNMQVQQQQMKAKEEEMAIERQKTMFVDAQAALKLAEAGDYESVVKLGMHRLQMLKQFPGVKPEDTQRLTQLAIAARNGSEEAAERLKAELQSAVQVGTAIGVLVPEKPEEFTLAPGAARFSGSQMIAQNTTEPPEAALERERLGLGIAEIKDRMAEREADRAAAAAKEEGATTQRIGKIESVINEIDQAYAETTPFATGISGAIFGIVPGSSPYNLQRRIDTIKANLGFDELSKMREASPTGGALGQVSERELTYLQSTLTSLDPGMGDERLKQGLLKAKQHYNNWKMTLIGVNPDEVAPPADPGAPAVPGPVNPGAATAPKVNVPWSSL